jgi:competence protein ComFB
MLQNYMEVVVDHLLPGLLDKFGDICKCTKCTDDIKAIALNNLKPCYVVTHKGEVYAKVNELEIQFRTDGYKELVNAIEVVSKNTRHNL